MSAHEAIRRHPGVLDMTDAEIAEVLAIHRAEVLTEAAGEARGAVAIYDERGEIGRAAAARALAIRFTRMAERAVEASEKCTPGGDQPREDEATHAAPRPRALSVESFARARNRAGIAGYFRCARWGRDAAAEARGAA